MANGVGCKQPIEALTVSLRRLSCGRLEAISVAVAGGPMRVRYGFIPGATPEEMFVADAAACLRALAERARDAAITLLPDFEVCIGGVLLRGARVVAGPPMDGVAPVLIRFRTCEGLAATLFVRGVLPAQATSAPAPRPAIDHASLDAVSDSIHDALDPLFALRAHIEDTLTPWLGASLRAALTEVCDEVAQIERRCAERLDLLHAQAREVAIRSAA
jgi:hypothetical protein